MRTLKEIATDHKAAWDAGNFEAAAGLMREAREVDPTVKQGPDGTVLVDGVAVDLA